MVVNAIDRGNTWISHFQWPARLTYVFVRKRRENSWGGVIDHGTKTQKYYLVVHEFDL